MRTPVALALLVALLATGCTGLDAGAAEDGASEEPDVDPVRVAAGPDAETLLLGEMMVALLELDGIPAETVSYSGAQDSRQALELGAVDVRPAYTGEAWLEALERGDPPGDPRESYDAVREHDAADGIAWLRPRFGDGIDEPPANATFTFVVQGPPAIDADLRTLSQLAARLSEQPDAPVCVDREFGARPDGLRAVLEAYSVRSERPFLAADPEEAVLGVMAGDCIAGLTTATDGRAWRAGLRPLIDDLRVFPAFVPLPQVRHDALLEDPSIRFALNPLATQLTTTLLGEWNARVAAGEPVDEVALDAALVLRERVGRPVVDPADPPG